MDFELLLGMRGHVAVAHHVPGRIRLKVSISALADPRVKSMIKNTSSHALPRGVKNYRVNFFSRSVVVEYDQGVIDPSNLNEVLTTNDQARFELLAENFKTLLPVNG
ncbi:MAG: HMA2 domain-containing protein [Desulfovibrio sp.]